ncbi:MAG: M16 family metallopeptidase [Thermoplasmata archaeon]
MEATPGDPRGTVRFELGNGLRVVLAPRAESPTASAWVWYRVGSKNEWPGVTGASHWVEHMLFQGSPRYPKGEIDRAIVKVGGSLNAFTDCDFTAYFSTVPREHLRVPLEIESDRMTRALLDDAEVERERTVIRSEREGNENWPEFRAEEELYALAFTVHPYRWDTLGLPQDILALTPEDLRRYYHRFYGTRNAILVLAGGFDGAKVRSTVESMFSNLPASGEDPAVRAVEPPSRAERRSILRGPGTTPFLHVGWRAPPVDDPTTPATVLLDVILGGETRLFAAGQVWGRAHDHPSSRLYRRLVDPGLAVRATSEWRPRLYPGLLTVHAQAARNVALSRLEEALDLEIDALVRRGPTAREMDEARVKVRRGAELAYEGASRTGFRLGYFSTLGRAGLESRLFRAILSARASDVHARAREIFRPENRSLVQYLPEGEPHAE